MKGNKTYRFRIINAGFALPFEIYIEKVIVLLPNTISIFKFRLCNTVFTLSEFNEIMKSPLSEQRNILKKKSLTLLSERSG